MSDTPRTTDRVVFIDGNPWVNAPFAVSLERELNAANQRIKQLEAVVNDPEALWANWLRGTVKLPSGIGDVRQYQDRIKRLEEFARTIENDFDHDEDAHRYGTTCRVCDAEDLLKETKEKEAKP